jgi:hypothetical protein
MTTTTTITDNIANNMLTMTLFHTKQDGLVNVESVTRD